MVSSRNFLSLDALSRSATRFERDFSSSFFFFLSILPVFLSPARALSSRASSSPDFMLAPLLRRLPALRPPSLLARLPASRRDLGSSLPSPLSMLPMPPGGIPILPADAIALPMAMPAFATPNSSFIPKNNRIVKSIRIIPAAKFWKMLTPMEIERAKANTRLAIVMKSRPNHATTADAIPYIRTALKSTFILHATVKGGSLPLCESYRTHHYVYSCIGQSYYYRPPLIVRSRTFRSTTAGAIANRSPNTR